MKILVGGIVVHADRDIKVHAPHSVYDGNKNMGVDKDIVVNGNAQHLADGVHQLLSAAVGRKVAVAVGVGGVELVILPALPHHKGVPGHRNKADFLVHRVIGTDHDGVGTAADLVLGAKKEGPGALFSL